MAEPRSLIRLLLTLILFSLIGLRGPVAQSADIPFVRGDANVDGSVNLSDGIWLLQHLFQSGPGGDCFAARDFNADGTVDLADALSIIQFQLLRWSGARASLSPLRRLRHRRLSAIPYARKFLT